MRIGKGMLLALLLPGVDIASDKLTCYLHSPKDAKDRKGRKFGKGG